MCPSKKKKLSNDNLMEETRWNLSQKSFLRTIIKDNKPNFGPVQLKGYYYVKVKSNAFVYDTTPKNALLLV